MSIKSRVRGTSEAFMGDPKVLLTSAPSHLLRFHCVCCVKEVSELINRPAMFELHLLPCVLA